MSVARWWRDGYYLYVAVVFFTGFVAGLIVTLVLTW